MAIKRELDKAYELTPHIIQYDDITVEEYMVIGENLHNLPGINVTTDWERDYYLKVLLRIIWEELRVNNKGFRKLTNNTSLQETIVGMTV